MPEPEADTIATESTPASKHAAHRRQVGIFTGYFLLVMLVATAILGVWAVFFRPHFSQAGFASIREGMTVDEVFQILGRPDDESTSPRWGTRTLFYFQGFAGDMFCVETNDGRVTSKDRSSFD